MIIAKNISILSHTCRPMSVTAYLTAPDKDCITLQYFHLCHTAVFLGVVIIPLSKVLENSLKASTALCSYASMDRHSQKKALGFPVVSSLLTSAVGTVRRLIS